MISKYWKFSTSYQNFPQFSPKNVTGGTPPPRPPTSIWRFSRTKSIYDASLNEQTGKINNFKQVCGVFWLYTQALYPQECREKSLGTTLAQAWWLALITVIIVLIILIIVWIIILYIVRIFVLSFKIALT